MLVLLRFPSSGWKSLCRLTTSSNNVGLDGWDSISDPDGKVKQQANGNKAQPKSSDSSDLEGYDSDMMI